VSVSVLRSGLSGSCCCCSCLLTNCLVVPVRCLGFYQVLLCGPVAVAVVCLRCICSGSVRCTCFWSRTAVPVASYPVIWSDILSLYPGPCIWSCHLYLCKVIALLEPGFCKVIALLLSCHLSTVSGPAQLCTALYPSCISLVLSLSPVHLFLFPVHLFLSPVLLSTILRSIVDYLVLSPVLAPVI
jgi:hypothetical protein